MAEVHGDLLELVRTEQQLDGQLAAARAEAAQLVAAARARADAERAGLDAEVQLLLADLERQAHGALAARLSAVDGDAARQVRIYQQAGDDVVQALAERMVRRLIDLDGAP